MAANPKAVAAAAAPAEPVDPALAHYRHKTNINRIGLWLFLVSDAFTFGGLLVARAVLWGDTRPELDQTLGLFVTIMLLLSSFSMNRAETAITHGDLKSFNKFLMATIGLGTLFVLGVLLVEWPLAASHGVSASKDVYGAVFYTMTGMHAFHVITGLIFLVAIWNNARKGMFSAERHWQVEAGATYWHFVDVVWMFFYPALYLIGHLVG